MRRRILVRAAALVAATSPAAAAMPIRPVLASMYWQHHVAPNDGCSCSLRMPFTSRLASARAVGAGRSKDEHKAASTSCPLPLPPLLVVALVSGCWPAYSYPSASVRIFLALFILSPLFHLCPSPTPLDDPRRQHLLQRPHPPRASSAPLRERGTPDRSLKPAQPAASIRQQRQRIARIGARIASQQPQRRIGDLTAWRRNRAPHLHTRAAPPCRGAPGRRTAPSQPRHRSSTASCRREASTPARQHSVASAPRPAHAAVDVCTACAALVTPPARHS